MAIQNADAEYMKPIFENLAEEERKKPRMNCPRHGTQLMCARCKQCLECRTEEQKADNLAYCKRERHTFLNLSAPCEYCREKRGSGHSHSNSRSVCGDCFLTECYEAEERRRR